MCFYASLDMPDVGVHIDVLNDLWSSSLYYCVVYLKCK
jgi:hypothetical protein